MDLITINTHVLFTEEIVKLLRESWIKSPEIFLKTESKLLVVKCNNLLKIEAIEQIKDDMRNRDSFRANVDDFFFKSDKIKTGIKCFDMILEGGLVPGQIIEFCGDMCAGKTLLCNTIALNLIKNESMDILYICTKGDFSAVRLLAILKARGFSKVVSILNIRLE